MESFVNGTLSISLNGPHHHRVTVLNYITKNEIGEVLEILFIEMMMH
jgi:hypothetical protein